MTTINEDTSSLSQAEELAGNLQAMQSAGPLGKTASSEADLKEARRIKSCENTRRWRLRNIEKARASDRVSALKRYHANRERIRARRKELNKLNRDRNGMIGRERHRRKQEALGRIVIPRPNYTPEQRKAAQLKSQHKWRDEHREELRRMWREKAALKKANAKISSDKEYAALIDSKSKYDKMYRQREKAKRRKWAREFLERNRDNELFQLTRRLRSRIRCALKYHLKGKTYSKAAKSMELIGCSIEHLKLHIEAQFQPGMSWSKRSLWHLDHIRPCAAYNLSDPAQQRACFNWKNLQPLWAEDNLKKGDRLDIPIDTQTMSV